MAYTIVIYNQKGGVGKTATAINTAYGLSELKLKVLLVDVDPNRNASGVFFTPEEEENSVFLNCYDLLADPMLDPRHAVIKINDYLSLIPSHISLAILQSCIAGKLNKQKFLKKQLMKLENEYDVIIIDSPPTMCDLSLNAIYAADFICIVVDYQSDSLKGMKDLFRFVGEIKEDQIFDYKILRNNRDLRKKKMLRPINENIIGYEKINKVFNTIIDTDEMINIAKYEQETVFTYSPNSKCTNKYRKLCNELKTLVEECGAKENP